MTEGSSEKSVRCYRSPDTSGYVTMDGDSSVTSNDGIDPPLMVLFPPERLSMKWTQVHSIGAGLENMGNTCFLNSALQCLTYTPPLANYLLTGEHSDACHNDGFCMMCTMEEHIFQVFCNSGNVICPVNVLCKLKEIGSQFDFGIQEDAHEFLQSTMAAMQQSCLPDFQLDRQSKATTFIHQVFGGYLRSRVTCLNCNAVSDTFEPFLDIPLEIQTAHGVCKALVDFVNPEQLGGENAYRCSKCHQMVTATKGFSIHRSSNVLALLLKRFSEFEGEKIMQYVRYPEYLDIRPFMSDSKGGPQVYSLYAVLVHSGATVNSGHYFCYIKASDGQWYKMNDSSVSVTDTKTVLSQQAYVLLYVRSSDAKTTQENGNRSPNTDIPGQASAEPTVIPNVSTTVHHNTAFIGPLMSPHMIKITQITPSHRNQSHRDRSDRDRPRRDQPHRDRSARDRPRRDRSARDRPHRDRSPHDDRHSRDWELEHRRDRTLYHPKERNGDRTSCHDHRSRSREDWRCGMRRHGYHHHESSHRWREGRQESWMMTERAGGDDGSDTYRSHWSIAQDMNRPRDSGRSHVVGPQADKLPKRETNKRQQDSKAEKQRPGAAWSHWSSRSEESKSLRRGPPENHRRLDYSEGRGDNRLPSNHTSHTSGSAHHQLSQYSAMCISEAEKQRSEAALSHRGKISERRNRRHRHREMVNGYYQGCLPERLTDHSYSESDHLLPSNHSSHTKLHSSS